MKLFHKRLCVFLWSAAAAGCASQRIHDSGIAAYNRGDYEEGIAKLAQAVHRQPDNLVYRFDLRSREESAVQKLIATARDAQSNGKPQLAEATYRRVLSIEPANDRARTGLDKLRADRRHAERIARAEAALAAKQLDVANSEVRAVLAEDPDFAPAVALAARIEQARGPITPVPRLRTSDNRPVTLQFRDAPTKMVFEVLARQTGVNFIFDKDVKSDGKTTIFVSQVPVEQAIELILAQNQLARELLSDNMVLVYPNTVAKQKDYQDEIVHTFFLANAVPKDAESMLKTVLGAKTLYIDERSNALTMRDTPEHVRMAEKLIASLDEPEPEVIMEIEVLEITHTLADQLGINYPTNVAFAPTPITNAASATGTAAGLVLSDLHKQNTSTITVSNLGVSVDLLKTVGDTNVLSSPRIRAKNKEKAKILVGDRVPVVTSGTSATTGGSYSTSSVQYLDVGLTVEVQPTIHNDGNVGIKVGLEVSSITKTLNIPIGNGGTTLAYQIGTRNTNTVLELRDGETQVLAGLIQDNDSRTSNHIPGLGDLPLLGRLFGSDGTNRTKTEIVMSITPHIIRAQERPSSDTTEFWYGTESQTRSAPFLTPISAVVPSAGAGPAMPGGVSYGSGGGGATSYGGGPHAAPAVIDSSAGAPAPSPAAGSAAGGAASGAAGGAANGAASGSAGSAAGGAAVGAASGAAAGAAAGAAGGAAAGGAAADIKAAAPASSAATDSKDAAASAGGAAALSAAAAAPAVAPAEARPKVTLEGPDSAKVGDEIGVSVKLAAGQALGRVRAQVRFDATALQLISAEPGDMTPTGDTPKVDIRAGGVQLELAGSADAPVSGTGSVIDMRFRVVAPRPAVSIDTQVVLVGEDGVAVAATAATPLKIAVSQ
jgi:general secretion pathway protein D